MILQSVKCSCCRQQLSSLINLTAFLEEICCVYWLRKRSHLEKVPEGWNAAQECLSWGVCPGLAQHSLLGSVCPIGGAECVCGCHCPCCSQQHGWSRWQIWGGVQGWTAELHHCCSTRWEWSCSLHELLAVKTQTWCSVCSLHSASPETFILKYGSWNLLQQ